MRATTIGGLVLAMTILATPLALACNTGVTPGDRRPQDGGPDALPVFTCPTGETCDPSFTGGLAFAGALPMPHSLAPVARSAHEAVRVYYVAPGGSSPELTTPGWAGPFAAASSDETVLTIRGVAEPDVDVVGAANGSALLRIVSTSTGDLFDRVTLEVADVATTHLTTHDAYLAAPGSEVVAVARQGVTSSVAPLTLAYRLVTSDERTVWDDSLAITGRTLRPVSPVHTLVPGFALPLHLALTLAAADASGSTLDLAFARDAGDLTRHLSVVDASAASAIVVGARDTNGAPIATAADGTLPLPAGSFAYVCAVARNTSGIVAGAPITISVTPTGAWQPEDPSTGWACGILVTQAGLTLTASIGALVRDVTIVPVDAMGMPVSPLVSAGETEPTATLGDRAARPR